MTDLQARLFAGRALRDAQAQEELARQLRGAPEIPGQRTTEAAAPGLSVVTNPSP